MSPFAILSRKIFRPLVALMFCAITVLPSMAEGSMRHGVMPPSFTLKTNVAAWALAVTNIQLEYQWHPRWSACLPISYSAWNYGSSHTKFRTASFMPEIRHWINLSDSDTYFWWYVGAHMGIKWYNVALGKSHDRYQDHDGKCPALGGGLDMGFRMPMRKGSPWGIEVGIGAGIYHTYSDIWHNGGCGELLRTEKKWRFGLDFVGVSVTYSFKTGRRGK